MSDTGDYGWDAGDPSVDLDPLTPLDDFDGIRIGTAINADTNELLIGNEAFDMQRLHDAGLLTEGESKTGGVVGAESVLRQSQNAWGIGASASMTLQTGIVDASAAFYVRNTVNACRRTKQMKIVGSKDNSRRLDLETRNIIRNREKYLACATEDFRDAVNNVFNAAANLRPENSTSFTALVDALTRFYRDFGTGFVHQLNQIAIGVFEGYLDSGSASTDKKFGLGGGFSFSLPLISAGAAADFCRTEFDADSESTFYTRHYGRPADCRPAQWAEELAATINQKGIDECIKAEVWQQAMDKAEQTPVPGHSPKPLPKIPLPTSIPVLGLTIPLRSSEADSPLTPLPDISPGTLDSAISEMHYRNLPAEYKPAHPHPSDDEKKQALQREFRALKERAELGLKEINEPAGQPFTHRQPAPPPTPSTRAPGDVKAAAPSGDAGEEHLLKGYIPSGYSYMPWSDVFPELTRLSKLCTASQVMLGQSLVWFSIRGAFAQYLDFCTNFADVVGPDIQIRVAASEFREALNEVGDFLTGELPKPADLDLPHILEEKLKTILLKPKYNFQMYDHYRFWIDNYDWLQKAPFGVVPVVMHNGQYHFQENPYPKCPLRDGGQGLTPTDTIVPQELIGRNAYRLYPIISNNYQKKPNFVWVGAPSRLRGDHDDAVLRFSGVLSFYPDPSQSPTRKPVPDGAMFDEITLPALIHQSQEATDEFHWAEENFPRWPDPGMDGVQKLQKRWELRKAMYGMLLYPSVLTHDGFDSTYLQPEARRVAREASRRGMVLPDWEKTPGDVGDGWALQNPDAAKAAYFPRHDALFFWGPAAGPGWDLFDQRDIRLVPVTFDAVHSSGVRSGGRPMWLQFGTADLLSQVQNLGTAAG